MTWNYDRITGQVRAAVPALIAWFASRGIATTWWEDIIITVVVTVACMGWSYINNKPGKIIASTVTGKPIN